MTGVQALDVSWLHHSQKTSDASRKDISSPLPPRTPAKDDPPMATTKAENGHTGHHKHLPSLHHNQPDIPSSPVTPKTSERKSSAPSLSRKSSWISSISSKFSSNQPSPTTATFVPKTNEASATSSSQASAIPIQAANKKNENAPPAATSPRSTPGFLSSALRRLSSSGGGMGKASGSGAVVPRRIMNVDVYRERCLIKEVQPAKLRRVSFCVDVEIAGQSVLLDDDTPPPTPSKTPNNEDDKNGNSKKMQDKVRIKDKAEGEALKRPVAVEETKEKVQTIECTEKTLEATPNPVADMIEAKTATSDKAPNTRKKEKKKRSEEERKERKEKKRQAALANGMIPMEFTRDGSSSESPSGASTPARSQDRPTIDPLRIYRRCCQLRETQPLRKIVEQLGSATVCDELHPGTIICLYLAGSRFQFSDIVTLGDYLAVVPVRKLIIDDCALTDEAIRVILAGLLAVKTPSQAKFNRELPRTPGEKTSPPENKMERLGVIEKISMKNNPQIGPEGWKHIACFINMSRTLKAIDLSMIPFPASARKAPPQQQHHLQPNTIVQGQKLASSSTVDTASIFEKCLKERRGARLEELVMAECALDTSAVGKIVSAVKECGVSRLGLASNSLNTESITVLAEYLKEGRCEGLDLGGNILTEESLEILCQAFEVSKPTFCALSLADTGLTAASLRRLLPILAQLPDFRFIDLSHNRKLFEDENNSVGILRRVLPKMHMLKRINLNDVAMKSEHCISLVEILPEIPLLAHLSILENPALIALASASDEPSREEACALYASFIAAVRVSKSIVSIDIEVPTAEAGEIVQALAKQVVAYSLRNLERNLAITNATEYEEKAIHFPDILLHIVGTDDTTGDTTAEPATDDDYIVGGTGVAKALSVCLGNRIANDKRRHSSMVTTAISGDVTPEPGTRTEPRTKAMSVNLLLNARKIRARLQPAIANEEAKGDEMALRRLRHLETTLSGIIQRFEDEYPEARLSPPENQADIESTISTVKDPSFINPFSEEDADAEVDEDDDLASTALHAPNRLSRHGSMVEMHSKHLAQEEGHMHRFGQKLRRDILRPQVEDHHHGTTGLEEEPDHIRHLRTKLEQLSGDEIKHEIKQNGLDNVIKAIGSDAEQLKSLANADPAAWKELQMAHGNAYSKENIRGAHGAEEAVEDGE